MDRQKDALHTLTAVQAHNLITKNLVTVEEYAHSLLARIRERDHIVKAWAYLDPDHIIRQAKALDKMPKKHRGPLHGVAIGIKDVINTKDMPTQYGSAIYRGYEPKMDSSAVAILRAAGALLMGKTATTEFAVTNAGPETTNPHDPARTPGGSSASSAAAVADFQVPLSLGVQSGGSIIRPASYTGVYALKSSYNAISTAGQRLFSVTYDTNGFFARSLEDLQVVAEVFDIKDDKAPEDVALTDISVATIRTPTWSQAGPGTVAAMEKAAAILRGHNVKVEEVSIHPEIDNQELLERFQTAILCGEAQVSFLHEYRTHKAQLAQEICDIVENKEQVTHGERLKASHLMSRMRPLFADIASRYSVILAPSAIDEAPVGLDDMGSPIFNTIWTVGIPVICYFHPANTVQGLHVPVINIPAFVGENGMPIGVSLVAARNNDQHLLKMGRVLSEVFMTEGGWKDSV